ncbi:MAG: DUF1461 domain-containing protein [Candidatus Limnocylindrales bacterium]
MTTLPSTPRGRASRRTVVSVVIALSTVIVIVGATIALFFNPIWVGFAQDRAGVDEITGYTPAEVRTVMGVILSDVIVGPPQFIVEVGGQPVLTDTERGHMVDVFDVVRRALAVLAIAVAALILVFATNRGRAWPWRAVAAGSGGLVAIGVVIGIAVVFFFDAAWMLFHRVFFPQGNFMFDPETQRLVQLLPGQFWTESATAVTVTALVLALVVTVVARRQAKARQTG